MRAYEFIREHAGVMTPGQQKIEILKRNEEIAKNALKVERENQKQQDGIKKATDARRKIQSIKPVKPVKPKQPMKKENLIGPK